LISRSSGDTNSARGPPKEEVVMPLTTEAQYGAEGWLSRALKVDAALRLLAEHHGLIRYGGEPGEARAVRVMLRLPWSGENRVVATQALGTDDPLDVMVRTIEEALGEVQAQEARRSLRLA
jgi:hypothetical protein